MKNPKLEIYRIKLKPTPANDDLTFKKIFQEVYLFLNPGADLESTNDSDLKKAFFQYLYNKIDLKFNDDQNRKKAFYARAEDQNGEPDIPIKLNQRQNFIDGRVKV